MSQPKSLTVSILLRAAEGRGEELARELGAMLFPTRGELGCVAYEVHRSREDRRTFFLYETWIDQAAFDAHIALPHVQRLLGLLGGLLESPPQASRWYRLEHMPDSKCRISQLGTA